LNEEYIVQLSKALNAHASIPDDQLAKIINIAYPIAIKKDDYFIRAGEIQPWLGFVITGVFRCFHWDDTGAEYIKHFFKENDFMTTNSHSLVDTENTESESDYYCQAVEDSMVLKIDKLKLKTLLTLPCWQEVFLKEMEYIHRIEERRIKQLLLDDAETRYLNFLQDFPEIENRVKQSYIASYIGVSPVSLSRIRTKIRFN
jgi:CRP-like cAMP-binding protein